MTLAERIAASGIHYQDLARAVGADPATAWRWANGKGTSLRYVFPLAKILDCDPDELCK